MPTQASLGRFHVECRANFGSLAGARKSRTKLLKHTFDRWKVEGPGTVSQQPLYQISGDAQTAC
ncbi:uncharacterized protein MYCFIDRAFT_180556 [Pseudocercospora fijiensis CIRAD86]|uniref:Uncharacterized protein n=1 Tax=Pseudocercospora fijiensis (strain CIRAD86) TaxID=383855 RepID=M3AHB7_PSEFD|nr:uncharacterized protein MYCFIDRAFT_180556 [Pseudocercospora fijiensis CIRAD86]EME76897.1 hypothetical protein MYCFIDRAFT_180556 [Pseudocercospora fijiensis CIRAD86]